MNKAKLLFNEDAKKHPVSQRGDRMPIYLNKGDETGPYFAMTFFSFANRGRPFSFFSFVSP